MRHIKFIIPFIILEDHVAVSKQFANACADTAIFGYGEHLLIQLLWLE